jgi:LPS O-antigen subunit length determinant protein (WzzB/FepE family)
MAMNPYMNNKTLLELGLKWKYHLGIIAVIAAVIAVAFSAPTFLKPKYRSFAVVYPVNLGEYSEESYTEQMLEILNSGDIREKMIQAFQLDQHYKIPQTYKFYKTALYGKFADNITFRKTENEAVRIEVLDTDPRYACAMVDSLRLFYDKKVKELHNIKYTEEFEIRKRELARCHAKVDSVQRKLSILGSEYGVMELNGQAEGLSNAYFQSVASGKNNPDMEKYYWNIAELAPEYKQLIMSLETFMKIEGEAQLKYNDAYRELAKDITYSVVVTPPFISDKKAWPKRSVIVLMSVLFTLVMAMVVIGVIENRSNTKSV